MIKPLKKSQIYYDFWRHLQTQTETSLLYGLLKTMNIMTTGEMISQNDKQLILTF